MFSRVDRTPTCKRRTDRRTHHGHSIQCASVASCRYKRHQSYNAMERYYEIVSAVFRDPKSPLRVISATINIVNLKLLEGLECNYQRYEIIYLAASQLVTWPTRHTIKSSQCISQLVSQSQATRHKTHTSKLTWHLSTIPLVESHRTDRNPLILIPIQPVVCTSIRHCVIWGGIGHSRIVAI